MIDDIKIAARVEGVAGVPEGMLLQRPIPGRPDTFGASCPDDRIYVTYTPATRIVTARISVPKWMHNNPVNYPLVPLRSVEDLRPDSISLQVAYALGFEGSAIGGGAEQLFPVRHAAVIRASYAADLQVPDPLASVRGLTGARRRNPGKRSLYGDPWSTIQWASKSLRSKLYAKGPEILSHTTKDGQSATLEQIATLAESILRVEVSFMQVRALRRFCKIERGLPTLAFMCDPRIDKLVLTAEAHRLRLFETYGADDPASFALLVRHVGSTLRAAQAKMAAGTLTMGRRKTLTPERIWDLGAAFFFLSGFKRAELEALSGKSRQTVYELEADLRALGIPADSSSTATAGSTIREIAKQLRPHVLLGSQFPPDLSDWNAPERVPYVIAPWLAETFDEDDLSDEPDEPESEEGEPFLPALVDPALDPSDIGLDDEPFPFL